MGLLLNYKKWIAPIALTTILLILLTIFLFYPLAQLIALWNENPEIPHFGVNIQEYYDNDFGNFLSHQYLPILGPFLLNFFIIFLIMLPFIVVVLLISIRNKIGQKKMISSKFCIYCGKQLPQGTYKFCPFCGKSIEY
jgi:hypothetical protein